MTKIKVYIEEIRHCSECPCSVKRKPIPDKLGMFMCMQKGQPIPADGQIPNWCPLPDKEGKHQ
jgi:hypothetical protein